MFHGWRPTERARRLGGAAVIFAAVIFAAAFASPSAAASPPVTDRLDWQSPPECPTASAVLDSLSELIDVERARWDRFQTIRGRVESTPRGWQLELSFIAQASTRTRRFAVSDCSAATDLAAVALALALDPEGQGLDPEADRASPPPASASPQAPEPTHTAPAAASMPQTDAAADTASDGGSKLSAPHASEPIGIELGLGGILDPTGLGEPSFGLSGWVMARRSRFSLGLHGDWLPAAEVAVAGGGAVQLSLAAAGLRGCYGLSAALGLCTEVEAGALQASGAALDNGRTVRDPWLAPGASMQLSGALAGAFSIVSRVGVLVPLVRGEYLVNGGEVAHRTPPVVMRLALGIAVPLR